MLTASGDFALVMAGRRMRVAGKFTMALPDTDYLDFSKVLKTINLDAQNTTELPDGVRDTAGFSSQGGSAVLAGKVGPLKHQTVAWLLNPDDETSPMYRQKVKGSLVTFSWGVRVRGTAAPELLQTFIGRVTSVDLDHAAGTVTLGLVDLSVDWDDLPEVPAVITVAPYNAGLTNEFPMDQIIRYFEGKSTWPARRPQPILSVGMRGTLWPEVGSIDTTHPQLVPTFAPGAWGTAYAGSQSVDDPTGSYWVGPTYLLDTTKWPLSAAIAFEATVTGVGATGLNASFRYGVPYMLTHLPGQPFLYSVHGLTVDIDDTGINVSTTAGSDFWTIALDSSPHTLLFWASVSGSTMTCHAQIDGGTVHNFAGISFTDDMTTWTNALCFDAGETTIEAWQPTTESAPVTSYPFSPIAVLDPSLNPLTVVPEIASGTTGWDELQTICAAEGGYGYRDGQGVFRFLNRNTIAQAPVGRTISSLVSLKSHGTSQGGSTEYHKVNATYTDWDFGDPTLLWTLGSKKKIDPGQTLTWTQSLGDGVLAGKVDTVASVLPDTHAFDDGNTWYRASRDADGINPFTGSLVVTITQITSGKVRISVKNPTTQRAWLVTPSTYSEPDLLGKPALWIGGIPAIQGDEAALSVTYGDGKTPLDLGSNAYWQDPDALTEYMQFVLGQVFCAVRDFTNVSIVPDARIVISDKDVLVEPIRSKVNEFIFVWGSSLSFDFTKGSEQWDQQLNVHAIGPPGAWIGGVAGRSEGDLTTFGY